MDSLTRCTSALVGRAKRRPTSFSSFTKKEHEKIPSSASTSAGGFLATAASFFEHSSNASSNIPRMHEPGSSSISLDDELEDGSRYQYDMDFDMDCLRRALLQRGRELDESGYQSVLQRSQHSQYGTGWMMFDSISIASNGSADEWDGYMTVGGEKVKIKEVSDLLATRYAFLSGSKTKEGLPVLTFPDSRIQLPFPDYRRLVTYLLQVPSLEDSYDGYVVIVDRRSDKWAAIKTLLVHIANYFPGNLRVVYLLKPEGVLQRALEVGYKSIVDSCHFHIVLCHNVQELHARVSIRSLTLDLGGSLKYNHLEWVQHRMDIERMRASTQVIAHSLEEFSRCLKDTELPNDAETTQHILDTQRSEREAIKEDFHIAVRRGLALLKNVRQAESKPSSDQLSPTRLHNVTSIERMLIQLDETEKSFEKFWTQHERRLQRCLELRRFEDDFRKLQSNFASHMLHLEEHRDVGDSIARVDALIEEHTAYMNTAQEDTLAAENLKRRGEELILVQEKELQGSLRPKCQELERMAEALKSALHRRLDILHMSKQMHEQIGVANTWCAKGVELLTKEPLELLNRDESKEALIELDDFLTSGIPLPCVEDTSTGAITSSGRMNGLATTRAASTDLKTLVLMTTTDTRTLLQQVTARIEDIKKMCECRRNYLNQCQIVKMSSSMSSSNGLLKSKPVGAVSPDGHKLVDYESPSTSTSSSEQSAETVTAGSSVDALSASKQTLRLSPQGSLEFPITCPPCQTQPHSHHNHRYRQSKHKGPAPSIDRKLSLPSLADLSCPKSPSTLSLSSTNAIVGDPCSPSKADYVIRELVSTEETYVNELRSVIDSYSKAFENDQLRHLIPDVLRGRRDVIFGNLSDIHHFHSQLFLKDLSNARTRADDVARCFLERRAHFYLYNVYCQNKPKSEQLRQEVGETHPFFQECQRMAGHRLPLGAYLLKPVQRITKYQLMLKELSKHCSEKEYKWQIDQAVDCVLELLQQLNASMHQNHISAYPGDLSALGQLLLEGKFSVWSNRKNAEKSSLRLRRTGKAQRRHLFLYTKAVVFCKHRFIQATPFAQDFYEFKFLLPIYSVSLSEYVKGNPLKFELTVENRQESHIFLPADLKCRNDWLTKLKQLILDNFHSVRGQTELDSGNRLRMERPVSWTSQTSSDSSRSSRDLSSNPDLMERLSPTGDTNNNPPSPTSLAEVRTNERLVSGDFSDSENNTVTSDSVRLLA